MTMMAVVFPGQGSQREAMLGELSSQYPEISRYFTQASEILGYDLWKIIQENPEDLLNQTAYTQPAILVASYCLWKIFSREHEKSLASAWVCGHSLGEYSALLAAEVLNFEDAVHMVSLRGQLMQAAMPGAMAVILGISGEAVVDLCGTCTQGQIVQAANFNTDQQTVISGERPAVERVMAAAKASGAKRAILLPVSVAAHSECMRPAAEQFAAAVAALPLSPPKRAFVSNVSVHQVEDLTRIRQDLVAQLYSPVQWVKTIHYLQAQGCTEFLECGPGSVLTGLNQRIVGEGSCHSVDKLL